MTFNTNGKNIQVPVTFSQFLNISTCLLYTFLTTGNVSCSVLLHPPSFIRPRRLHHLYLRPPTSIRRALFFCDSITISCSESEKWWKRNRYRTLLDITCSLLIIVFTFVHTFMSFFPSKTSNTHAPSLFSKFIGSLAAWTSGGSFSSCSSSGQLSRNKRTLSLTSWQMAQCLKIRWVEKFLWLFPVHLLTLQDFRI